MAGLFLLLVAGLWLFLVSKVSKVLGKAIGGDGPRGAWFSLALLLVLLPLPLMDEIVGGFQFRALCKENASQFQLGIPNPEGRTARVTVDPANRYLTGRAIRIRHSHVVYTDASTGEPLVAFDTYVAEGGALIRGLGISENNSPITIGSPACSPEDARAESARLTFKLNTAK